MDEDDPPPMERSKPSQIPSWVSLGFALGALFVMALPRHTEPPAAAAPVVEAVARAAVPQPITTVEAVFEEWEKYAVWSDGSTQVALWNPQTKSFSDCYEVLRIGDNRYFRSIPALTRPVLTHGVISASPLLFTESGPQRAEWLNDVRQENWKSFSSGAKDSLAPAEVAKPENPK